MQKTILFLILVALVLGQSLLWSQHTLCTYCFQKEIAENFEHTEDSVYKQNALTRVKHGSLFSLSDLSRRMDDWPALRYFVLLLLSVPLLVLFFAKLFNSVSIGLWAGIAFVTHTTLPVTLPFAFLLYLCLLLLYRGLADWRFLLPLPVLLWLLFRMDVSAAFTVTVLLLSVSSLYLVLFSKQKMLGLRILFMGVFVFLLFEGNFLLDFLRRLPLLGSSLLFYLESYPRGTYFYLYSLSKLLLLVVPLFYLKKILDVRPKTTTDRFLTAFLLSMLPLALFFTAFGIAARIFDYFTPLLAAITVKETRMLFRPRRTKVVLAGLFLLLVAFSILAHFIPPRVYERYSPEFLEALGRIPQEARVYTDAVVANALITVYHHGNVTGPDYNLDPAEHERIYYLQDEGYITQRFKEKHVDYFVISSHSWTRGLDILNATHFLQPVAGREAYDRMSTLETTHAEGDLRIWKVNHEI